MSQIKALEYNCCSENKKGEENMSAKTKAEMKRLLKMPLSSCEQESLEQEGFYFTSPTKETLILVALYKKAICGDMNALKEIRSMVETESVGSGEKVTIIDNVQNNDS